MVYRKISPDMKDRAIFLVQNGWQTHQVAEILGISVESIERWQKNNRQYGCTNPSSSIRGRPRLLNNKVIQSLLELLSETPTVYLDEIQEWLLLYHNLSISTTALDRNLRDLGLSRKAMQHAAAERDEEFRQRWLQHVLSTYTADQMIVLDESSKDGRTLIRKYGRSYSGLEAQARLSLQRGTRYSILPALTVDGYMAVRVVEGSIDSAEFFDFVLHDVLPHMSRYPGPCSVIMLDNCAIHKSNTLKEVVQAAGALHFIHWENMLYLGKQAVAYYFFLRTHQISVQLKKALVALSHIYGATINASARVYFLNKLYVKLALQLSHLRNQEDGLRIADIFSIN